MSELCADGVVLFYVLVSFLFVDRKVQLKLVGECYVKSFVKTIFAIKCIKVCLHYMHMVCFQSGGGEGEKMVAEAEVATSHLPKIYRERKVVLVGKIHVYSLSLLPFE